MEPARSINRGDHRISHRADTLNRDRDDIAFWLDSDLNHHSDLNLLSRVKRTSEALYVLRKF